MYIKRLCLLIFLIPITSESFAITQEKKLISTLFSNYNKQLRPVMYPQDIINVKVGVALVQLLEFNGKEEYMTSNLWMRLVWKDVTLRWQAGDYGNITVIRVAPSMLWTPDIILWNTKDGQNKIPKRTNVLIYPSGEALWVPPAIFKASCSMDATYFPFDQQTCIHKFGSASYSGRELSFTLYNDLPNIDLTDYWRSDQWELVEVPALLNSYSSPTDSYPTEDVTYYITFRRKLTNYVITLLLISIVLAFMTILSFILPTENAEKLILEVGCLVGSVIVLLHINATISSQNRTPLIVKYLLTILFLNMFALISTSFAIYFNTVNKSMPQWVQKYLLRNLRKFLICGKKSAEKPAVNTKSALSAIEDGTELNSINKAKSDGQTSQKTTDDIQLWRELILIMDRFLFIIFAIIILIATIFLISKNFPRSNEDVVLKKNKGISI